MGQASNRKWTKRALRYLLEVTKARKQDRPIPDSDYSHRKFWRTVMRISNRA